jgi:hypothetical protein
VASAAAAGVAAWPFASGAGGVSSRPKMRSDDAIACWSAVYLSLRSEIGRKNRCVYWRNATSVPSVMPVHITWRPPYHTISDTAIAPTSSSTGKNSAL